MRFVILIEAALLSFAAILIQIPDLSKHRKSSEDDEYTSRFRMDQYSFSEKVVYQFTKFFSGFVTNIVRYLFNTLLIANKMFIEDSVMDFDNLILITSMFNNVNDIKQNFWDMISLFFKDEL